MNDVYRDELRLLGFGYPLYEPGPTDYDRIRIGDVGIITDAGAFQRCFNVFRDKSAPVNVEYGVPSDFVVEDPKYAKEIQYTGFHAGCTLKSEHIQSIEVSASMQIQRCVACSIKR